MSDHDDEIEEALYDAVSDGEGRLHAHYVLTHLEKRGLHITAAADTAEALLILRAILATDERGQGTPFAEAMDRAKAFVERFPEP